MDWQGWLGRVAVLEKAAHPDKRVTLVTMPGGLPEIGWNVPGTLYMGHSRWDTEFVSNMRLGIYGSFHVRDGPFSVTFSDGSKAK